MANGGRRIEKNLQHLTLGVPKSLLGLGLGFRARVLFKIFFIQTKIAQLSGCVKFHYCIIQCKLKTCQFLMQLNVI